jgi:hypothetical protein
MFCRGVNMLFDETPNIADTDETIFSSWRSRSSCQNTPLRDHSIDWISEECSFGFQEIAFLQQNEFLIPLIIEALDQIEKIFGYTETVLKLESDPEEDHQELFLYITTDLEPYDALKLLNELDDIWWLDNIHRAKNKMTIALRHC